MEKTIKVSLIFKKNYNYFSETHFDRTTKDFFLNSLTNHPELELSFFPCENEFDTTKLKGKCDVILLANNRTDATPENLIGIDTLEIPVVSRVGDPHHAEKYDQISFHEQWKISHYFGTIPKNYFYKFYPETFDYDNVIFGLEPELYQNLKPFDERIKNRILNSGATGKLNFKSRAAAALLKPRNSGWYFYKLRTKCNTLPYVDYRGLRGAKFPNSNYSEYLSQYQSAIAATTYYPTQKYWEIPAAGCLTFMEITPTNFGDYLGFKDNETAIFINEKNYKNKFEAYLSDPENNNWKEIAEAGHDYTIKNLTNDIALEKLIEIFKKLI
tara:strand:+ start:6832 stop:7812 length:981 start_codon:yes stop_codon:yes gene_type:complete